MKIIAHRGNLRGPDPLLENNPLTILKAISHGYDVEIDLWHRDGELYLGHDEPVHNISWSWLFDISDNSWVHCKNLEALQKLSVADIEFNYFWHQNDDYTLTSNGTIWTYPGRITAPGSVCILTDRNQMPDLHCLGVCTDWPIEVEERLK